MDSSGVGVPEGPERVTVSEKGPGTERGESPPASTGLSNGDRSAALVEARQCLHELCHDVRGQAAAIMTMVAAAETLPAVGDELREYLERISAQARITAELCRSALDEILAPGRIRLDELAASVAETVGAVYGHVIQLSLEPASVLADDVTMWRMLSNLVSNACRAAGPSGTVAVGVHVTDGEIRVEVSDSGSGFGTVPMRDGIGLLVVESAAKASGARLEIGTSLLGGACVSVIIPRHGDGVPPPRADLGPESRRKGNAAP